MPVSEPVQGIAVPVLADAPNLESAVDTVVDGLVTRSVMRFDSAAHRGAVLTGGNPPVEGMLTWLRDQDKYECYNGSAWQPLVQEAWTTYSPTWTGGSPAPNYGNAVVKGRYCKIGRTVTFNVEIVMGSVTTFGNAYWKFSLPVLMSASQGRTMALCGAYDASTDAYRGGFAQMISTVPGQEIYALYVDNVNLFGGNFPFLWAVNDVLTITGVYESAA